MARTTAKERLARREHALALLADGNSFRTVAALVLAYGPPQADLGLDVLPQALGPLLTSPKLWHLLSVALCALVCAKRLIQATTSDHICAQG